MKAKFFFLGLCALALAACSIDEVSQVNDTNAIQFKATTATRATATTTNNISEFSVWAWNTNDGLPNEFMDGVVATRNGSSSTFTTSPLYFWPTGTVDFYAVSPVAEVFGIEDKVEYAYFGGTLNEGDDEGEGWSYTGNVAKATIANDNIVFDVVIPSKAEDQIDLCYAITKNQSSGSVTMNFRHALSQVTFKAKDVNEDFVVDIAGVSVCSVFKTGTYTLKEVASTTTHLDEGTSTSSASGSQGVWDYENEGHKARFAAGIEAQTLATDGTPVNITSDPLMLLPQEVAAWDVLTDEHDGNLGSYIAVLCHVTENGSTLWPNANEESASNVQYPLDDGVEYAYIAMPVDIDWEEGYRYTYTIVFGEGLGYYPPDDPNWELDGTPVLVPITFKVTVDEFQDAEGVDVPTDTDLSYIEVSSVAELEGAVRMGYQEIDVVPEGDATTSTLTLDGYLEFNYDCTLNLGEGVTITGPDATDDCYIDHNGNSGYTAIIYVNGCNLTITGEGTVQTGGSSSSDYTNAIWVVNGTVTIYGGTYKGSNWNGDTSTNYVKQAVYCGEGGYAYIYDGDFYAGKSSHPSTYAGSDGYAWVLNCHNDSWENGHAMIYCYGGTYHDGFDPSNLHVDDADSYVADGYGVTYDSSNNSYTVVYTKVTSLNDLKSLISEGASDITIDEAIELDQGDVLYFTNDCHLTLNADLTYAPVSNYTGGTDGTTSLSIIVVGNGATLTIDAADDVNIACDGSNGNNGDDWVSCISVGTYFKSTDDNDPGHLIINGGNYKGGVWNDTDNNYSSVPTIYIFCGDVEINGGNFVGGWSKWTNSGYTYKDTGWAANTLNCLDAPRKANTGTETYAWFFVKGGSFREFNPANNASEGNNTNYVVDGYASTSSTGTDGFTWFTVTANQ